MSSIEDGRISLRRVTDGRKCGAFAGVCVMLLLLSGSIMGLAMMASGETYLDLVDENDVNWKVKDVSKDPNLMNPTPYPVYYWDYRFPEKVGGALEFEFNDAADEWYTVYLDNVWEGSLSNGMIVTAVFVIESTNTPVFEARLPDDWTQVCLHFTTTGGAWEPQDLWFSYEHVILTSCDDKYDSFTVNKEYTLKAVLDIANWFPHSGTWSSEEFDAAIADIHEIGFSFGRAGSVTSGVALSQGDATFVLKSFELTTA